MLKPLFYLPYLKNNPEILFTTGNLIYLACTTCIGVLIFFTKYYKTLHKFKSILVTAFSVNILFIVLSFLGLHPWSPSSNRCISMVSVLYFCTVFLGVDLFIRLTARTKMINYLTILLVIVGLTIERERFIIYKSINPKLHDDIIEISNCNFQSIYVDRWASPSVKYLFEYGVCQNLTIWDYPGKFTFDSGPKHNEFLQSGHDLKTYYSDRPKMNDLKDYDLLIAPELYLMGNNDEWVKLENTGSFWVKKY